MVGIRNIQIGYSDGPLDQVCLPDCLKGAGKGVSKLYGLRGDLLDRGLIHNWRPLVGLCQKIQDEPRPSVLLGNHHNLGQLEVLPK